MNLLIITELPAQIAGASPDFWDRLVSEKGILGAMVFGTFLFVVAVGWKLIPKLGLLAESHTILARTSAEELPKIREGFQGFARAADDKLNEIRDVVKDIREEVVK